jgi:hypothetical protein
MRPHSHHSLLSDRRARAVYNPRVLNDTPPFSPEHVACWPWAPVRRSACLPPLPSWSRSNTTGVDQALVSFPYVRSQARRRGKRWRRPPLTSEMIMASSGGMSPELATIMICARLVPALYASEQVLERMRAGGRTGHSDHVTGRRQGERDARAVCREVDRAVVPYAQDFGLARDRDEDALPAAPVVQLQGRVPGDLYRLALDQAGQLQGERRRSPRHATALAGT